MHPCAGGLIVADNRFPDLESAAADMVIISSWGFWHRPLTLLEASCLQSLVDLNHPAGPIAGALEYIDAVERAGAKLIRKGEPKPISVSALAQYVGNAIPAEAMAGVMQQVVDATAKAAAGDTFSLCSTEIWVDQHDQESDRAF
jgi:hypothetical protein